MNINKIIISAGFVASVVSQYAFHLVFEKAFISSVLIVFSIFFGFYITSFAVFATSKYLSTLYEIQDEYDNRKTLLDTLLGEFKFATNTLLVSIIYLISFFLLIEHRAIASILEHFLLFVLFLNIFYMFKSISVFIKITRQSAKGNG